MVEQADDSTVVEIDGPFTEETERDGPRYPGGERAVPRGRLPEQGGAAFQCRRAGA